MTKTFEVWVEASDTNGHGMPVRKLGETQASSFTEACDMIGAKHENRALYNSSEQTWYGCKLYPTEKKAKHEST